MRRSSASSARGGRVAKIGKLTTRSRRIDVSEIHEISDAQLRSMRRVGRPPIGKVTRQLIAIRLDPGVLGRMRQEAKQQGVGYQTLINEVLARYAKRLA